MSKNLSWEDQLRAVPAENWVIYGVAAVIAGVLLWVAFFMNADSPLYTQPDPTSRSAKIEQAQRDLDRAQKTLEELR